MWMNIRENSDKVSAHTINPDWDNQLLGMIY